MSNFFGVKPLESKTLQKDESSNWTTKKVNSYLKNIETGYKNNGPSPFFENKINLKKGGMYFNYTIEEEAEILKCMKDAEYFSDTYGYAMTDDGIAKIELRDYQKKIIKEFQDNRYISYLASRQVGKCFLGETKVKINESYISIYKIYYNALKKNKKLSIYDRIKYVLYKLYTKLN
jgi:hypothetical protein